MQIKFVQANLVLIALLLFLNVELHFTACNSYGSENKKTLKLGYRIDAPPFSYCSNFKEKNCKEGEELGYSVDICRHIAENAVKTNLYDDYKFIPVTAVNQQSPVKIVSMVFLGLGRIFKVFFVKNTVTTKNCNQS